MEVSKKIFIIGQSGMLAQALIKYASKKRYKVFSLSRTQGIDLSRGGTCLTEALNRINPSLVINAAGITDLKFCEDNPSQAWMLHVRLPAIIASWANKASCKWVHISTDHYFNDQENVLHTELDTPNPLNEYALSKLAGESLALTSSTAFVVRTNIIGKRGWLGSPNFAEWVMQCLHNRVQFDAFTDTWASSIEVGQFANLVLTLVESGETGLMNLACSESISKANLIERIAQKSGVNQYFMRKVKTPAPVDGQPLRANAMGLNCSKAQHRLNTLGLTLPDADEVVSALIKSFSEK
jgi:dTDP-4-dehydrorhamnose reductase